MNIVIPMAGDGTRFKAAGFDRPKPLIEVNGEPLYALATKSLPLDQTDRVVFIIRAAHDPDGALARDIDARFGRCRPRVVALDRPTEGQSITVLHALPECVPNRPLLVFNCDSSFRTGFDWAALQADGALATFPDRNPRWSFVRRDGAGTVVEVAEKRAISDEACTGAYWFRTAAMFRDLAEARVNAAAKEAGEYYIAPLYNDMLRHRPGSVVAFKVDEYHCFGTPADLTCYRNGSEPWNRSAAPVETK